MRPLLRILRTAIVLVLTVLAIAVWARDRWHHRVDHLITALDAQQGIAAAPDLRPLPEPVARYLASAVPPIRELIRAVDVETDGEFRLTPDPNGWRPFHARQRFNTTSPGFVWDARIAMAPLFRVFVRDAYADGVGEMVARADGVYPLANESGSAQLAEGQLMRYLAEAVWFPFALRPGHGVTWTAIDEHQAMAVLTDRGRSVALQFTFNGAAEVVEVLSPARGRAVGRGYEPTPWAVRCWDHQNRLGFTIPIACEAEWRLPEGPLAYWRGRVTNIRFDAR